MHNSFTLDKNSKDGLASKVEDSDEVKIDYLLFVSRVVKVSLSSLQASD